MPARRHELILKLPARAARWLDRRALALVQKRPRLCLVDARGLVLAAEARKKVRGRDGEGWTRGLSGRSRRESYRRP